MASLCTVCGLQAFLLDSACQGIAQASGREHLSTQSQRSVPDQMLGQGTAGGQSGEMLKSWV